MVVGPVALGDQAGALELVEARLLEPDREGPDRLGGLPGGKRRQPRRVDPSGEQDADRDVGDQVGADGVAEGLAQLVRELARGAARGPRRPGPGTGGRSGESLISPSRQASVDPAGSLRASAKIVIGAGTELKARYAATAWGSISRENPGCSSIDFSSEANDRSPSAKR